MRRAGGAIRLYRILALCRRRKPTLPGWPIATKPAGRGDRRVHKAIALDPDFGIPTRHRVYLIEREDLDGHPWLEKANAHSARAATSVHESGRIYLRKEVQEALRELERSPLARRPAAARCSTRSAPVQLRRDGDFDEWINRCPSHQPPDRETSRIFSARHNRGLYRGRRGWQAKRKTRRSSSASATRPPLVPLMDGSRSRRAVAACESLVREYQGDRRAADLDDITWPPAGRKRRPGGWP